MSFAGQYLLLRGQKNMLTLPTARLHLVLETLEEVRAMIAALTPAERAEVSPDWLAQAMSATVPDPWTHGFKLVHLASGAAIGQVGFKGPPTDGMVEIAYGVNAEHQGQGYATEAAAALTAYAFASGEVRVVRAHTLPPENASTRVLTKCGFQPLGEVVDPEDGLVWRWEKLNE
jgi:RimJ/RimL family protein N-acetyltransferase